jgi:hypothetical protein
LNEKLTIFDTYTGTLTREFAGFNSLGIDWFEWDSIKASYRSRINASTSKGAFAGLMSRFAYVLRELLAYARDTSVLNTPLNPGTPILIIGEIVVNHFGAVLTVLPDSALLVLRNIDDHPLDLQPGDIVLGYEGIPWKKLVYELLESGIPFFSWNRDAKSAQTYSELVSAGMNWHLFETIDIVKYSRGDTVHLPVYPMVNLPVQSSGTPWYKGMWNNEQLPVPGVPFFDPNHLNEGSLTYGIIEGTNIGYIYLWVETFSGSTFLPPYADEELYNALKALKYNARPVSRCKIYSSCLLASCKIYYKRQG